MKGNGSAGRPVGCAGRIYDPITVAAAPATMTAPPAATVTASAATATVTTASTTQLQQH